MNKLILFSLLSFSLSSFAQTESTTEIPTEPKKETLPIGEMNLFVNPMESHKGHYLTEFGLRISPSWILSVAYGNGFIHGGAKGGMSTTGFSQNYYTKWENSYELNHSAIKMTWAHGCRRTTWSCWNLTFGFAKFVGVAQGWKNDNGVVDDTFRGKVEGEGLVVGYGYTWRWESGLNIRVGLENIHSNDLGVPEMVNSKGERMSKSIISLAPGLHTDAGIGYWF